MTNSSTAVTNRPLNSMNASPWIPDVVIATRNRPNAIRECLISLNSQTLLPACAIVVDSSEDSATRDVINSIDQSLDYTCSWHHSAVRSAARQRNLGAMQCGSRVVLFLDDDVVLEPDFIAEIVRVFEATDDGKLGGVSGTISNQVYSDPHGLNRLLLRWCIGKPKGNFAGNVVGPAVNFLPVDQPDSVQAVEWLPTTCTAYRRDVFMAHRFEDTFEGYSFAEDVHLSTRVAQKYRLLNTTRARVFHADLGKDTHRDWVALGESQVRNRHLIMTAVLGRDRLADNVRLFAYEMIYCPAAWLAAGASPNRFRMLGRLLRGKIAGFWKVWTSTSSSDPHE